MAKILSIKPIGTKSKQVVSVEIELEKDVHIFLGFPVGTPKEEILAEAKKAHELYLKEKAQKKAQEKTDKAQKELNALQDLAGIKI